MTIVQLEYLLAVANCGSFSQASDRCCVTQPSLSMQIKNLEEELGTVLLDRSRKPVIPTDTGRVVIERAREAVQAFRAVRESVADLRGEVSGVLRVGILPTVAPYLLHRLLPVFARRFPRAELHVREMTTADLIRALDRDMLDAAVLTGGTVPAGIREEELFNDPFHVYLSVGHPLSERSNVRIEDIDVRRLLLLSEGNCLRDQVIELCQLRPDVLEAGPFECGSLETLMRVVDCTPDTMTVIPEMVLDFIDERHRAQVKPLAKGATSRKITMAVRRTCAKKSLVAALREAVLEAVAR